MLDCQEIENTVKEYVCSCVFQYLSIYLFVLLKCNFNKYTKRQANKQKEN